MRQTRFEMPALCTTSTTSFTSLYASGASSTIVPRPEAFTIIPLDSNSFNNTFRFVDLVEAARDFTLPAP